MPTLSTVFEPCCGRGAMSNFLEQQGLTVIKRDLYFMNREGYQIDYNGEKHGHDFLLEDIPPCEIIITNPPFYLVHLF